ncbi:hypothetical protein GOV12_03650 [Candidatus Pacearchaeota archaeon]|nr:hypothetical protein [Candidatus Pacearchaeota archaeon]
MDNFIKKIFEGVSDDWVHSQFQKYSRGEFPYRALIRIKNSKGKYTIATTAEYAKEFVRNFGEKLGEERTLVTGAVISALDLEGFTYKERKMAMGVRKYMIESEMSGTEIVNLCDTIEKAFFGLSFKVGEEDLIIKPKSPKSAKGASSSKNPNKDLKIDFCKIKTTNKTIVDDLLFDSEIPSVWKKIEVTHKFIIDDIIVSDELKEEKDFSKVREMAKRKGKIERVLTIDGNEVKKEVEFLG